MSAGPVGLADLAGPIWLDTTRLLTRVGRGALSGIDRVELAYLDHLLETCPSARFLCRTTRGYLLFDAAGATALRGMATGAIAPRRADLLSRVMGRGALHRHRAEATLRPLALDRCRWGRLQALVARTGGANVYLNVGHSSLTDQTLAAGWPLAATLIHDLIPLSHPELCPPDQSPRFAQKLSAVRRNAQVVLVTTAHTRDALRAHWQGAAPDIHVVPLGIDRPEPADGAARQTDKRSFVAIGTIELRKNHDILLQAWSLLADRLALDQVPELHIIGAPGWRSDEILQRIADHPLADTKIIYHGALPDTAAQALLSRATALLYPSLAEGYGLPPFEALTHGVKPICADLPVLRETLGERAVYVNPTDAYAWMETIKQEVEAKLPQPDVSTVIPDWQSHFASSARFLADHHGAA